MISTSSTAVDTTQIGDYIFRMAYRDDFQGPTIARYAYDDLDARRAAVFRQQDDNYSFGLAGFMIDAFEALGGEVAIFDFVANTVDFSAQLSDLRTYNPDVIFYAAFCAEGASLLPQLRQQGFEQRVIGADAIDDSQCPTGGGAAFDGVVHTGFAPPELLEGEARERAEEFRTLFDAAYPDAADFNGFTLAGADSYYVLVEAIRVANAVDSVAVREALSMITDFPGVSGDITYAGTDGSPLDRTIAFIEYQVRSSDDYEQVPIAAIQTGTDDE
jgi:branched-chain amino acid transport system substrate-binding protein